MKQIKGFLIIFALALALIPNQVAKATTCNQSQDLAVANCWYVDNTVSNSGSGLSWANAWKDLTNIDWTKIKPGDTIYISGGSVSQTYNSRINPQVSGTSNAPITISVGQDAGHNGIVILDRAYSGYYGIYIDGQNYITVSGQVGSDPNPHIRITHALENGVFVHGDIFGFHLSYLDITQNGNAYPSYGFYASVKQNPNLGEIDHIKLLDNLDDELELTERYTDSSAVAAFGSLKVHDNEIYNWHADATKISLGGVDFYNNSIHDRGVWHADHPDGVQYWSSYVRIFNNKFYNFDSSIYITGADKTADTGPNSYLRYEPAAIPNVNFDSNPRRMYIYNNLFYETIAPSAGHLLRGIELSWWPQYWNTSTNQYVSAPGANVVSLIQSVSNMFVTNNTFINVPFFSVNVSTVGHTGRYLSDVVIENNVFKDNCNYTIIGCSGLLVLTKGDGSITYGGHGSGADVIVDYNSVYASSSAYKTDIDFGGMTGSPDIIMTYSAFKTACGCSTRDAGSPSTDQKIDANFSPMPGSPLIDSGINQNSLYTADYLGSSRPQGLGWDIGAYEYVGSGSPTPLAGDLNLDHIVNSVDYSLLNSKWFTTDTTADLNHDGLVNAIDFSMLNANWLRTW